MGRSQPWYQPRPMVRIPSPNPVHQFICSSLTILHHQILHHRIPVHRFLCLLLTIHHQFLLTRNSTNLPIFPSHHLFIPPKFLNPNQCNRTSFHQPNPLTQPILHHTKPPIRSPLNCISHSLLHVWSQTLPIPITAIPWANSLKCNSLSLMVTTRSCGYPEPNPISRCISFILQFGFALPHTI